LVTAVTGFISRSGRAEGKGRRAESRGQRAKSGGRRAEGRVDLLDGINRKLPYHDIFIAIHMQSLSALRGNHA